MKILAFDPSIKCTGYALVCTESLPNHGNGCLLEAGTITPEGEGPLRCFDLWDRVREEIYRAVPNVVVVETPMATKQRFAPQERSSLHLPTYGMAVGVVLLAARHSRRSGPDGDSWYELMHPAADEWTKGMPGSKNDKNKTRRVAYAASLYGREVTDFGPVTTAGNVADAVLLAFWAMGRADEVMAEAKRVRK